MYFEDNHVYHIFNRGINKQQTFHTSRNYQYFLAKVKDLIDPFCEIIAYCLMPNHFHLLVRAKTIGCQVLDYTGNEIAIQVLSKKIGVTLGSYTQGINKHYSRTGSLWQQKTKAIELDRKEDASEYFESCIHYIHQNPTRAGLVRKMRDWPYSSYREFLKLSDFNICQVDLALSILGKTPIEFLMASSIVKENRDLKNFLYKDSERSA